MPVLEGKKRGEEAYFPRFIPLTNFGEGRWSYDDTTSRGSIERGSIERWGNIAKATNGVWFRYCDIEGTGKGPYRDISTYSRLIDRIRPLNCAEVGFLDRCIKTKKLGTGSLWVNRKYLAACKFSASICAQNISFWIENLNLHCQRISPVWFLWSIPAFLYCRWIW